MFKKIFSLNRIFKESLSKNLLIRQTKEKITALYSLISQNPYLKKTINPLLQKASRHFQKLNSAQKTNSTLALAAVFLSVGIFYLMSVLISTGKNPKSASDQNVSVEFLLNKSIDELELRARRLPKKPEEEKPPPETPKLKTQQAELEKPELSSHLPQLELPEDFQSDKKGASVAGQAMRDSAVTPIFRMNPIYPRRAALQNIEGFVILKFDIMETGQVDNISVIQASPPQIFNSSAVQALRKWKYKPRIEDGKAIRQKNLKVQLDFRLTNE